MDRALMSVRLAPTEKTTTISRLVGWAIGANTARGILVLLLSSHWQPAPWAAFGAASVALVAIGIILAVAFYHTWPGVITAFMLTFDAVLILVAYEGVAYAFHKDAFLFVLSLVLCVPAIVVLLFVLIMVFIGIEEIISGPERYVHVPPALPCSIGGGLLIGMIISQFL